MKFVVHLSGTGQVGRFMCGDRTTRVEDMCLQRDRVVSIADLVLCVVYSVQYRLNDGICTDRHAYSLCPRKYRNRSEYLRYQGHTCMPRFRECIRAVSATAWCEERQLALLNV